MAGEDLHAPLHTFKLFKDFFAILADDICFVLQIEFYSHIVQLFKKHPIGFLEIIIYVIEVEGRRPQLV